MAFPHGQNARNLLQLLDAERGGQEHGKNITFYFLSTLTICFKEELKKIMLLHQDSSEINEPYHDSGSNYFK